MIFLSSYVCAGDIYLVFLSVGRNILNSPLWTWQTAMYAYASTRWEAGSRNDWIELIIHNCHIKRTEETCRSRVIGTIYRVKAELRFVMINWDPITIASLLHCNKVHKPLQLCNLWPWCYSSCKWLCQILCVRFANDEYLDSLWLFQFSWVRKYYLDHAWFCVRREIIAEYNCKYCENITCLLILIL